MGEYPPLSLGNERESLEAAVEAGRLAALGELTPGAAHEINNPLFAILTLVDFLLRDAEPGTKAHERLRLIEASARDIEGVVGRVHRFARERPGDGAPFPLEDAAAAAVDLVRHTSAARDLEIAESYPPAPALVAGDVRQLKQLFVSLLLHAARPVPRGGTITVTVAREDDGVVASVEGASAGEGADLALSAAYAAAELNGGTLARDTTAPGASRFVLRLPGAET